MHESVIDHIEAVLTGTSLTPPLPTPCTSGCLSWPAGSQLHSSARFTSQPERCIGTTSPCAACSFSRSEV